MTMTPPTRQMARPRRRSTDPLTLGLIVAFGILALITMIIAFVVVRNMAGSWTSTGDIPGAPGLSQTTDGKIPALPNKLPGGQSVQAPLQAPGGPTPQPWDGASRVNILIMGLDFRDWQAGEVPRTDTMMIFTLDPVSNTAGMLSIPRDMWVNIPGFDYAKINTAYYLGEIYKLPGGGPALATKTVENFLGVPINYYAQIDFNAFVKFIDDIGGVDVNIPEEMVVDPLGPGNTIKLRKGMITLDGATALAFARNRHIEGDDFTRARNQQLLIMALRKNILSLGLLPTLVAKAPSIYQDIADGIHTNMSFEQIIKLAVSASQVPAQNIKRAVIGTDAVSFATSPDGLSILIPVPDKIRLVRDKVFTSAGPLAPAAVSQSTPASGTSGGDPLELAKQEKARVIIQNGTSMAGLASKTAEYLRSQGINVVGETNADRVYDQSTLVLQGSKPYTLAYLSKLMNVGTGNIYNRYDPNADADVVIIVGNDWSNKNPMPQ
jgi:polyisoprenyl-teichoic acid--peptidoglycan teichoic acid transferase